jgi:hypothetical protein
MSKENLTGKFFLTTDLHGAEGWEDGPFDTIEEAKAEAPDAFDGRLEPGDSYAIGKAGPIPYPEGFIHTAEDILLELEEWMHDDGYEEFDVEGKMTPEQQGAMDKEVAAVVRKHLEAADLWPEFFIEKVGEGVMPAKEA